MDLLSHDVGVLQAFEPVGIHGYSRRTRVLEVGAGLLKEIESGNHSQLLSGEELSMVLDDEL